MKDSLILSFDDIGPGMLPVVGGKAMNLGLLSQAEFPVPQGFCLTTAAYDLMAEAAGLDKLLEADGVAPAQVRDRILATPVPDPVIFSVRQKVLDSRLRQGVPDPRLRQGVPDPRLRQGAEQEYLGPVAVRSSATAEDLPFASFAGQQDTYLDVSGAEDIVDAVRRCWASLWTDRAFAYREANDIDHRAVRLAVVIQEMVPAEVAGVMFTANPVTGRRRESVIDAAPGLGEAVVSGAVNPDHFVVDTPTSEILARNPGAESPVCLTDAQVRELAQLGDRVEQYYGAPQDTEWAIDPSGKIWLTQARPITSLYPLPETSSEQGMRVFFNGSLAQGLYRPITPMGLSIFRYLSSVLKETFFGSPVPDRYAGAEAFHEAGGRLFVDVTEGLRGKAGREILPRVLGVMEARSSVVLRALLEEPWLAMTQPSMRPFVRRVLRIFRRHHVPQRAIGAIVNPAKARERVDAYGADFLTRIRSMSGASSGASPDERLRAIERMLAAEFVPLVPRIAAVAGQGFAMLGVGQRVLGEHAKPGELPTVMRGLPHNVTTEMDLSLWELATRIRSDERASRLMLSTPAQDLVEAYHEGNLPPVITSGLGDFLARHGERAVAEIDLGLPRWREEPAYVIGVIANYLRQDDPSQAPGALFARGVAEAEAMVEELAGRVHGPKRRLVRFALGRARALAGLRELPKFYIIQLFGVIRTELQAIGGSLAADGVIDAPDDIFFVTLSEVRAALETASRSDLRTAVAERRESYDREMRRRHIPRVLLSDGTEPEAVASSDAPADGALTGTAASPGSITGTARVILEPVGAHLEPGEILVCPSTDPGWTPLFLTAAGLVMEMGGANSHGAVVAREYGIPAVVGVPGAIDAISTGQEITVDGTSGTVTPGPIAPRAP